MLNIEGTVTAGCMRTSTIGHDQGNDTEGAHRLANDIHLPRMVKDKQGHLHRSICASANTAFGKIGTGRRRVGTNLPSRVPPLAKKETLGLHDQRTEDTRATNEVGLHRRK